MIEVKVGDVVLVKGVVHSQGVTPEGQWIEFGSGVVPVAPDDITAIVGPTEPTFALGDKVTDGMGTKFEVIMAPRETENGRMIVGLWSDVNGVDWQYPDRLKRLTE